MCMASTLSMQFFNRDPASISSWKLPNLCCRGAAVHESHLVKPQNSIRKMTPIPALTALKSFLLRKKKKRKGVGVFGYVETVVCALWPDGALAAECVEREGEGHGTKWAVFRCALLCPWCLCVGAFSLLFFLSLVSSFIPSLSRPSLFAVSFSLFLNCQAIGHWLARRDEKTHLFSSFESTYAAALLGTSVLVVATW